MTMPRFLHYFDMPVTGSFESEEEDFDKAIDILFHDKTTKQCVEHLVAHCEFFYSCDNVTATDQVNNPEVVG